MPAGWRVWGIDLVPTAHYDLAAQTVVDLVTELSLTVGQRYLLQNRGPAAINIAELPAVNIAEMVVAPAATTMGHLIGRADGASTAGEFLFTPAADLGIYVWTRSAGALATLLITEA